MQQNNQRIFIIYENFCSFEPGIYLPGEFGIRSEIDVYIHEDGEVISTGEIQKEVAAILR
jgi:Xaa-Pro aminopeptidase